MKRLKSIPANEIVWPSKAPESFLSSGIAHSEVLSSGYKEELIHRALDPSPGQDLSPRRKPPELRLSSADQSA
jgi:hypothetical protein